MIKLYDFDKLSPAEIFARTDDSADVAEAVRGIIEAVKAEGDKALFRFAKQFDHADLAALEVTGAELDAAVAGLEPGLADLLKEAAARIAAFHRRQLTNSFVVSEEEGVVLGQKVMPIEKVGLYVPGGTAAYPSSVLMNCIPAKIAGCREIVMVSPPPAATSPRSSWPLPASPGWTGCSAPAGPRRWRRWHTAPRPCPGWIKSSAPATPGWPRPSARCSGGWPST